MQKIIIILLIICFKPCISQETKEGTPWSVNHETDRSTTVKAHKPHHSLIDYYLAFPNSASILINQNISVLDQAYKTILPNGNEIYKLTIQSDSAKAISLYYDSFHIPEGGKFYIYNQNETKGAYTSINNSANQLFATEYLQGNAITLEYNHPFGAVLPELHINQIGYFIRDTEGTDASQACEVNINCSEGNDWQDEKKGVVRLLVKDGSSTWWCSGSLVNNTDTDCKPYILSAEHCTEGTSPADNLQSIVYFNYEASNCEGITSSTTKSLVGFNLRAKGPFSGGSDFILAELTDDIPDNYNPYFNGWDITNGTYSSGVSIHHPSADIKKISTYNSTLTTLTLNGGLTAAFHGVVWSPTTNGHGITEEGSSGSPLFNSEGLIIGTLTGGNSFCNKPTETDYYGKISAHWDQNGSNDNQKLSTWLDPSNTGITQLKGTYKPCTNSVDKFDLLTFKIYPNPASNMLHIEFQSLDPITPTITIIDLLGQAVIEIPLQLNSTFQTSVNTSFLAEGNYIVCIKSSEGTQYERVTISR